MFGSDDQPDAWQKHRTTRSGKPHSYHDNYGNSVPDSTVETHRERPEERDLDWELDYTEFLKSLPEMQRLAIEKTVKGIQLTDAERVYLHRARPAVSEWLQTRSLLRRP